MHSPVPLSVAKTLADRGADRVAWIRFNFRGVGASEGTYDDGRGELDDARAIVQWMTARAAGVPISICGHSFGSWVGLRAAAHEPAVDRALLIGPSTRFFDFGVPDVEFQGKKTIFLGDHDEFCDVDEAHTLAERLGADLRIFEGFDHHFTKSRRAVGEAAVPVIAPEAEGTASHE